MAQGKGLNLWMAVILLSGQMAGMGVLNLPNSMIGTGVQVTEGRFVMQRTFSGPTGFVLIIYFTLNAIFVGQRLGLCWTMIENLCPEYKEQAVAKWDIVTLSDSVQGSLHGDSGEGDGADWPSCRLCLYRHHALRQWLCCYRPHGRLPFQHFSVLGHR